MGETTGIAYVDKTWNCWQGCHKVSAGCLHCYMYREKTRYGQEPNVVVRSKPHTFNSPLRWKEPAVVFVCSWSDFFIEEADAWRDEAWDIIRCTPHLTYVIVTKRPERIADHTPAGWPNDFGHVWILVTAENQEQADIRVPILIDTPCPHRGVSLEPLLGLVDLDLPRCGSCGEPSDCVGEDGATPFCNEHEEECSYGHWLDPLNGGIEQIIIGGESGPKSRPYDLAWARSIIEQCRVAEVPCFHKQIGANAIAETQVAVDHFQMLPWCTESRSGADPNEWPADLRVRELAWRNE